MANTKEFLIQCDNEDREGARYVVVSVDADLMEQRRAALMASKALLPGLESMAFSSGFAPTYFDSDLPVSNDGLEEEDEEHRSPFPAEVQEEFEAERVAACPEGTRERLENDAAGFLSEVEHEDDRVIVSELGFMVLVTIHDGDSVIRSWTVTWATFHEAA